MFANLSEIIEVHCLFVNIATCCICPLNPAYLSVYSSSSVPDCVDGSLTCAYFSLIHILHNHTRTAGMQDDSVSEASTFVPTSTRNVT